jgi:hypothetical protein
LATGAVALQNIWVVRAIRDLKMLQKFDEQNRDLIVNLNGQLIHRDKAGISPFDSAVQGGDAVWEGLRLYRGRIFQITRASRSVAPIRGRAFFRRHSASRKNHR